MDTGLNDPAVASPTLDTPRLRLRDARLSDAGPLLAITAYDGTFARDVEDAAAMLTRIRHDQRAGSTVHWIACLRAGGAPVGNVGFYRGLGVPGPDREAEIGYAFVASARGQGLAGEALARACRYGFEHLGLARVVAFTKPDNIASRRLLARRGFRGAGAGDGLLRYVLDASAVATQDSSASGPDSPSS